MSSVRIRDVSPRLTFQAYPATTEQKIELIDRLTGAGVPAIEVSSFVNPKLIPGLADAEQVFARIKRPAGVSMECCVANVTGLKRAIDAGADAAWFLLAADEEFSRGNIGRSIEQSFDELAAMCAVAQNANIRLGTYVIAIFGGPTGLARGPEDLQIVAPRLLELGVRDWILADSCGYAAPPQMRAMVEQASRLNDLANLNVQVHDSRGMGLANTVELVNLGLRNIDTSLCGSGGHPAAPGAHVGGTCTEDTVQMLNLMGIDTGIDLSALLDAANWLDGILGGREKGFTRRVGGVPTTAREAESFRAAQGSFRWGAKR